MKSLTLENFENLVTKINTVLDHDNTWNMQTAFTALIEQLEKFENVFLSFEDETFVYSKEYVFIVEGSEFDNEVTIFQSYEDIKRLSIAC
ncbi:conserved hypothetical protein [Vibrio phage 424E50-1]|nr:conserved hypothetical protein [Vibrio phage 424E50-1]